MVPLTILLSLTSKGLRLLQWHLSDVLQHQPIEDALCERGVQQNPLAPLATFHTEHLMRQQHLYLRRLLKQLLEARCIVSSFNPHQHTVDLIKVLFNQLHHFTEAFLYVDETLFELHEGLDDGCLVDIWLPRNNGGEGIRQ